MVQCCSQLRNIVEIINQKKDKINNDERTFILLQDSVNFKCQIDINRRMVCRNPFICMQQARKNCNKFSCRIMFFYCKNILCYLVIKDKIFQRQSQRQILLSHCTNRLKGAGTLSDKEIKQENVNFKIYYPFYLPRYKYVFNT